MTSEDREHAIRAAALAWLDGQRARGVELFTQASTTGLTLAGATVRLMPTQQGIWKPASFSAALSIRTVYRPQGVARPYEDDIGPDGAWYKMRGDDPQHSDNRALRAAMDAGVPLIWFQGTSIAAHYTALYPVYLRAEDRQRTQFAVDVEAARIDLSWETDWNLVVDEASYRTQLTRARLHQAPFRAVVMRAYENRCAVCAFRHPPLLDAAHILEDSQGGAPVVTNGLALCKMHHAAYDQQILGISPDLRVHINPEILAEVDGPMLRHGIQEFHQQALMAVPRSRREQPDRQLLEARFSRFQAAG